MASQQEASFTGVEMSDVRPGAVVDIVTTDAIAKGQSHVYEVLTGIASPGAAGIVATGHQHDAEGSGAPIRIPLAQGVIDANLKGLDPLGLTASTGWQRFAYCPFFVPRGMTEVSVVLCARSAILEHLTRVVIEDTSLVELETPVHFARVVSGHYFETGTSGSYEARVQVTAGAWNVIRLDGWIGKSLPGADDDDDGPLIGSVEHIVHSWHVLPVDQAPAASFQARYPAAGTQWLDRAVFTLIDSAQAATDEGLDAHLLRELAQNDGLLRELCTGRGAGVATKAQRQLTGHRHADDGATDLDDSGLLVDLPLGSWGYGVVRRISGADTLRASADEVESAATVVGSWSGNIFAPILKNVSSTEVIAFHNFRLPALKRTHLTGTSKIKFAALIWSGSTGTVTVGVKIGDSAFSVVDVESTATSAASGRVLITGEVDAEIDGAATSVQLEQKATVRLRVSNAPAKAKDVAIYGLALALDAS